MAVTQLLQHTYEVSEGFAAGNLDGQVGYAKVGASAHQFTVDASGKMVGAQSITATSGGASVYLADERAIGATRAAGEEWRLTFRALVETGASLATVNSAGIVLTAGAIDPATFATDALDITFGRSGPAPYESRVAMFVADKDYDPGSTFVTVPSVFDLDAIVTIRVCIYSNDSYTIEVDTANNGEAWTPLRSGFLVAANVAISRFSYVVGGPAFVTGKNWFDNLCFAILTTATKANLGVRPQRYAKIDTAAEEGVNTRITYSVYDPNTGNTLASGRSFLIPTEWLAATQDRSYVGRIDQAIADDLKKYDLTARVATLAASGHGLDF